MDKQWIAKVRQMLAERSLELPDDGICHFLERFGVKDISEIDSSFIDIIISSCDSPPPEIEVQQQEKDTDEVELPSSGLRERIDALTEIAASKINLESDRIAKLYQDVPNLVKSKVLGELQQQVHKTPDQSLQDFKNITEFWTIFSQDSVNNRQFTVMIFRGFMAIVLLLLAFNFGEIRARNEYEIKILEQSHQAETEETKATANSELCNIERRGKD